MNTEDNQKGGSAIVPIFSKSPNNPDDTAEKQEIRKERTDIKKNKEFKKDTGFKKSKSRNENQMDGITKYTPIDQLVNLQVYQPRQQTKQQKQEVSILPIMTTNPYMPPQFVQQYGYYPYGYIPPPVLQKYNITMQGPSGNHTQMHMIYEDILPKTQFNNVFTSLINRLSILDFVRATFIKRNEGEDIAFDDRDNTTHSLIYYMKFMELNPFNNTKHTFNPYTGLPSGFLLYKSCYPIKQDESYGTVICARNSIGMLLRIYNLSNDSYKATYKLAYDEWRELNYYQYIRDSIIQKKVCPNFVSMYAYFINTNKSIDFKKVAEITKTKLTDVSGNVLLILTESPTYNLHTWAVKTYVQDGNKMTMVQTGYHSEKVWYSVIFQIMAAMYTLQCHGIYIENFSLHNIFIKDLNLHSQVTQFWKYKIDNIEYYIPNYGFLVMVDSLYTDVPIGTKKIDGTIFTPSVKPSDDDKDKSYEMFKTIMNPSGFTSGFLNQNSIKPPENVIALLNRIYNRTNIHKDIGQHICENMGMFMNNRIGTHIRESEIRFVKELHTNDFIKGEIVVYNERFGEDKFGLYLEHNKNNNTHTILTRQVVNNVITENIITKSIAFGNLRGYIMAEPIAQRYNQSSANMNETDLLEIYVIGKL